VAEEKSPGGEIATGLRSIFERVGEFFHIFDLSFFVGGSMTFGAFAFLYLLMQYPRQFPFAPWVGVLALIIACYVCGLITFAIGRELSRHTFRRGTLNRTLPLALAAHNLGDNIITSYTAGGERGLWSLYIRMWSEVVHEKSAPAILHHLMRYWAMAATYDGVGFSLIVWAMALVAVQFPSVAPQPLGHGAGIAGALLCMGAALFAFRRGANYYEYQIEDLVAHFAVARNSLTPPAAVPLLPIT
jgi:hypothetical protein